MTTIEDLIQEMGIDRTHAEYPCMSCGKHVRTFALSALDERAVCADCQTDEKRAKEAQTPPSQKSPWDTDLGVYIKIERNRRINEAVWAVDARTSPLSIKCQAKWSAYVKALHRLTVDFATPQAVVWPNTPAIEYGELI